MYMFFLFMLLSSSFYDNMISNLLSCVTCHMLQIYWRGTGVGVMWISYPCSLDGFTTSLDMRRVNAREVLCLPLRFSLLGTVLKKINSIGLPMYANTATLLLNLNARCIGDAQESSR